jgi:uncharacterized phage-associated protein
MRTHDALAIANWFLARAAAEGKTLDPMKLQKLIYFAHGWSLALTDIPLITEHPEAWDYGPVIPSVYHEFKSFGRKPITEKAKRFEPEDPSATTFEDLMKARFVVIEPKIVEDPDAEALLERVWQVYGPRTGIQLSNMTHAPDGAWYRAFHELANGRRGVDISDALIKAEFAEKKGRGSTGPEHAKA